VWVCVCVCAERGHGVADVRGIATSCHVVKKTFANLPHNYIPCDHEGVLPQRALIMHCFALLIHGSDILF